MDFALSIVEDDCPIENKEKDMRFWRPDEDGNPLRESLAGIRGCRNFSKLSEALMEFDSDDDEDDSSDDEDFDSCSGLNEYSCGCC